MKKLSLVVYLLVLPTLATAQDIQPQTRLVFHTTADITPKWFATNWTIANVVKDGPDNINVFPGLGYRGENWWAEAMIQRQWASTGNSWALDFRYELDVGRAQVYLEYAPFLNQPGEYQFVFVNMRVWKKLSIGVEREGVQSTGHDSTGAGPRVAIPVASFGGYILGLSAAYQFKREGPDIPRLYIAVNRKFRK